MEILIWESLHVVWDFCMFHKLPQWLWLWHSLWTSITIFPVGVCLDTFGEGETYPEGDGSLGSPHFYFWTMAVLLLLPSWEQSEIRMICVQNQIDFEK